MKYTNTHFIAAKDCPFSLNGKNLTELRRPKLRGLAKSVDLNADGTKNELLGSLIVRLKSLGAPSELSEMNT